MGLFVRLVFVTHCPTLQWSGKLLESRLSQVILGRAVPRTPQSSPDTCVPPASSMLLTLRVVVSLASSASFFFCFPCRDSMPSLRFASHCTILHKCYIVMTAHTLCIHSIHTLGDPHRERAPRKGLERRKKIYIYILPDRTPPKTNFPNFFIPRTVNIQEKCTLRERIICGKNILAPWEFSRYYKCWLYLPGA